MVNQIDPRAMAGTYAPPFPKPVSKRMAKAHPKELAIPVSNIVIPMSTREREITRRVPYRAARKPPRTAKTK
jgi:hypothetical protein